MKKKIALLLAVVFSISALALTACTDKSKGNNNGSSNTGNQNSQSTQTPDPKLISIVGTWEYRTNNSDSANNGKKYKFILKDNAVYCTMWHDMDWSSSPEIMRIKDSDTFTVEPEKVNQYGHFYYVYPYNADVSGLAILDSYPNKPVPTNRAYGTYIPYSPSVFWLVKIA